MVRFVFENLRHEGNRGLFFSPLPETRRGKLLPLAVSLFFIFCLLNANTAFAGSASLAWNAPTERVNGTSVTSSEIKGYNLHYGTASGNYTQTQPITGNTTTYTIANLTDGANYYFAVSAIDTADKESGYSTEACKTIGSTTPCVTTTISNGGGNNNNNNFSTGGDTSISGGGGGCGFVKDNGKGPKAKGEGLPLMIMLIIILAGIVLRRVVVELKMRREFSALIKGLCFFVVAILLAQIAACGGGGGGGSSNSSISSIGDTTTPTVTGSGAFEGFGSSVTGGTGGTIVTVTNLNNSGSGSLRDALNGSNRIVQFSVAGTISLSAPITITGTNVTIDGFTAPSPGITITSASDALILSGNPAGPDTTGSNIIVRGLRFRNAAGDGIQIAYNTHDIVIDHNSMSASGDGEVDITEGAYNVTISNNILSKNMGPGPSLLNTDASHVSYHHNIYYGGNDRNPILTGGHNRNYSSGPASTGILADVRYNVIWNYGIGTYLLSSGGHVAQGNVVANLYRNNGSTNPSDVIVRSTYDSTARADAYIAGNVAVHDPRGCAYSYNSSPCFDYQTTNTQNNHAVFSAPAITGPAVSDQQGRLNEWLAVKNGAGVISKFADDANDNEVRTAIAIPSISIFLAAWND